MRVRVLLTMIVRNESAIIERCLDAAHAAVALDGVAISDTGSDDATVQKIEAWMQTNKVPGQVGHEVWRDFGHNRTQSIVLAKEVCKSLGFDPKSTFMLFLDADMVLAFSGFDKKRDLAASGTYMLEQRTPSLRHWNTRLARCDAHITCVGVTHEYYDVPPFAGDRRLHTLYIDDRNDGGFKADKFERDVRLLEEGLRREPDNVRYMFYLARSLHDLGRYEEAMLWFRKRVNAGGWDEEVFYASMQIGYCLEKLGFVATAMEAYGVAFNRRPSRAEPLVKMAALERGRSNNAMCCLYAEAALAIPFPKDDVLFVSAPAYTWEPKYELSIGANYMKGERYARGMEACKELCTMEGVPEHIRSRCISNMRFYTTST